MTANSSTAVAPDLLLQGSFFAMEQAGLLLRDAHLLYRNRRWPSALALAVLCIEELGKSTFLYQAVKLALASQPITREMILRTYLSHKKKLVYGRSIYTVAAEVDSWGEPPDIHSPELLEYLKRMEEADQAELERAPLKTHAERMDALYVHLSKDSTWNRPIDTPKGVCYELLNAAAIEYMIRRDFLFIRPEDPAIKQLLCSMSSWVSTLPKPITVHPPKV